MARFCTTDIRKAAKEFLDNEQIGKLEDDLKERAQVRAKKNSISIEEALADESRALNDEFQRQLKINRRNFYQNVLIRGRALKFIDTFPKFEDGLLAFLDGINSNIKNSKNSIGALQNTYRSKFLGLLNRELEDKNLMPTWHNRTLSREISQELFQEGFSSNKDVQEIAKIIKRVQKDIIKILNKNGADIKIDPNYIVSQTHDILKMISPSDNVFDSLKIRKDLRNDTNEVAKIAKRRWIDFILPKLDSERTFKGVDPEKFLSSAYDAMVSKVRKIPRLDFDKPPEPDLKKRLNLFAFTGPANLAKKISEGRVLFFNSGGDWFDYNKVYGKGNLHEGLVTGVDRGANSAAVLEKLGTNPEFMFKDIVRRLKVENRGVPFSQRKLGRAENVFRELTGVTKSAVNHTAAKIFSGYRAWKAMSQLGGAAIRSFPDLALKFSTLRYNGFSVADSFEGTFKDFLGGWSKDDKKLASDLLGVGGESLIGDTGSRLMAPDNLGGTLSRLVQLEFKLNGLHWWDQTNRTGMRLTLSRHLALKSNVRFSTLDVKLQNALRIFGIEDKEWELVRKMKTYRPDNKVFITPEASLDLEKEDIRQFLEKEPGEKLTKREIEDVQDEMSNKLMSYFNDAADSAIFKPGATERAIALQGTQAGTVQGEVLRSLAQYKMYTLSFYRRALMRELRGTFDGKANVRGLMELMVGLTGLGYLSISAGRFIKDETFPDLTNPTDILQIVKTGGGLAFLGDFLFGQYDKFGRNASADFAGPLAGDFADVAKLTDIIVAGKDPTKAAAQLLRGNIPYLNLFYNQLALQYMGYTTAAQRANPGFIRRVIDVHTRR